MPRSLLIFPPKNWVKPNLIAIEVLKAERGPTVDKTPIWYVNERYVEVALLSVSMMPVLPIEQVEENDSVKDLRQSSQIMAVIGYNCAQVVACALDGSLTAYRPTSSSLKTGEIVFLDSDLRVTIEAIKRKNGWIDGATVARRMGVKTTVLTRWVRNDLLTRVAGFGGAQYFDQKQVEEFVGGHVFVNQAAKMLNVSVLTVQKWARLGRLRPVCGSSVDGGHRYLFRKREIQRWAQGDYVSAPELARFLGISYTTLLERVRKGLLEPISGPGIDGTGRFMFERPAGTSEGSGSANSNGTIADDFWWSFSQIVSCQAENEDKEIFDWSLLNLPKGEADQAEGYKWDFLDAETSLQSPEINL